MAKGLINWLFGVVFNLAAIVMFLGVLLFVGALRGGVDMAWVSRTGLVLELLGITLFALEYAGVAQHGQSPLRWWLARMTRADTGAPTPAPWPRQMVLIVGVSSLVVGLVLQLLSTWDMSV